MAYSAARNDFQATTTLPSAEWNLCSWSNHKQWKDHTLVLSSNVIQRSLTLSFTYRDSRLPRYPFEGRRHLACENICGQWRIIHQQSWGFYWISLYSIRWMNNVRKMCYLIGTVGSFFLRAFSSPGNSSHLKTRFQSNPPRSSVEAAIYWKLSIAITSMTGQTILVRSFGFKFNKINVKICVNNI